LSLWHFLQVALFAYSRGPDAELALEDGLFWQCNNSTGKLYMGCWSCGATYLLRKHSKACVIGGLAAHIDGLDSFVVDVHDYQVTFADGSRGTAESRNCGWEHETGQCNELRLCIHLFAVYAAVPCAIHGYFKMMDGGLIQYDDSSDFNPGP
jgi:hypothetical protein